MIQFNLLPDVKIEYIKVKQRKRIIVFASIVASAVTFAIFLVLFIIVQGQQARHLKALDKDINKNVSKIQETKDLDKILTIQNQLGSLPKLHDEKFYSSRLTDYLNKMTPSEATISDVSVNFADSTMVIKGNSKKLSVINTYADTLKFTDYVLSSNTLPDEEKKKRAFKDVVLKSFQVSVDELTNEQTISYELSFGFEPAIFKKVEGDTTNGGNPVQLAVPSRISTRSETEKPAEDLFAPQPKTEQTEGQGN